MGETLCSHPVRGLRQPHPKFGGKKPLLSPIHRFVVEKAREGRRTRRLTALPALIAHVLLRAGAPEIGREKVTPFRHANGRTVGGCSGESCWPGARHCSSQRKARKSMRNW